MMSDNVNLSLASENMCANEEIMTDSVSGNKGCGQERDIDVD